MIELTANLTLTFALISVVWLGISLVFQDKYDKKKRLWMTVVWIFMLVVTAVSLTLTALLSIWQP